MKYLLITCLSLLYVSLSAQNYNYNEYLFPDLNVKGMRIGGNAFGNSIRFRDTNRLNGNMGFSISYFSMENTRKTQKFNQYRSDISYTKNGQPFIFLNRPDHELNMYFFSYGENRRFISDDKKGIQRFIEFDHIINLDYNYRYFSTNITPENQNITESWVAFPVKLGKGRLEPLAGIPVAEFLADDLLEAGLLIQPFTQDQVFQLAQKMVAVDNARVFDFRRANIYRLKELSTWLESQGIPQTIETFTILNDNFNFAFSGLRNQGKQQSIGLVPIFSINKVNLNPLTTGFGLGLQYERLHQKNISKNLHKSWRLLGNFYLFDMNTVDVGNMLHAGIRHDITYVPNSRTITSLSPSFSAMFLDFEEFAGIGSLTGSASYFVNHQLRITGSLNANYMYITGFRSNLTIPGVVNGDFYTPDFYRVETNRLPIYQNFNEKFNFSGHLSFSYFLF